MPCSDASTAKGLQKYGKESAEVRQRVSASTAKGFYLRRAGVLGDEELVKRQFEGLVQCMRDGVEQDGTVKVMSLEDGGESSEFTFGHDWIARGEGFSMESSTERW